MTISVIVPFWNSEKWLGRCCKSLDKRLEVILVDDHSTDSGREIAESYGFKVIENERTKGVSGARNTGLDYATGDWITFLDADDEMLPQSWETFQKAISDYNVIQLSHKRLRGLSERTAANLEGIYTLPGLPEHWWGVWNKLFRADFVKDIRFDESLQYGEDGMFVLECLKRDGRIYHADRHLCTTRHRFENPESLSHKKTAEDVMIQCRAYEEFLKSTDDNALKLVVAKEMEKLWNRITRMLSTF
jgi:glycosyltransferase involved in cell wall biosynthesis